uniref:Cytochrome c biogenesis protein Ccs1 n=1 Tax=Liagoropsis maxima TaxID=1653392 RepID=A0A1G4NVI5_9FLOR|nr:Cytochrome c biogenesis protein ccs1 [Liagoropsis maxima]SCW22682.1 Cytochrome c biogenesis protein ccs1 [Liagoropsis maxima]
MRKKILGWKIVKFLSNLSFSIGLLLTISLLSIIGTVIEQNQTLDYYQIKYPTNVPHLWFVNWEIIKYYKLDQLYTSWFFLVLILIFSMSLIVCTFSTQLPSLKDARRWKIRKTSSKNVIWRSNRYSYKTSSIIIHELNKIQYYVFYQNAAIYSYKGLYGRLAPIFVHISILLLLLGSIISLFSSFYIQEMVPEGELFNLQNVTSAGLFSRIPDHITGTVDKFSIEYYPNESIKQFYSSISLQNHQNKRVYQALIQVNKPFKFEGLTIYQTDWHVNGLRIQIDNNRIIQIPVLKITNNNNIYWITSLKYARQKQISFIFSDITGKLNCYNNNGQLLANLKMNKSYIIDHIPFRIDSILTSTGLQIKTDYGVSLIYCSFALLMITTVMSYISFSQIWIIQNEDSIEISGNTNRGLIKFEEDLWTIKKYI